MHTHTSAGQAARRSGDAHIHTCTHAHLHTCTRTLLQAKQRAEVEMQRVEANANARAEAAEKKAADAAVALEHVSWIRTDWCDRGAFVRMCVYIAEQGSLLALGRVLEKRNDISQAHMFFEIHEKCTFV